MKFSIILPTYNRADTYLKEAIDSVISQTYKNWELLIIDNHSADNTDELISNYKEERIELLKIHNNGNIAKSRNLGIKNASGDYTALLDSDDYWDKKKLEICAGFLNKESDCGMCHSEIWKYPNRTIQKNYGRIPFTFSNLLNSGNLISLSSTIIHTDILNDLGGFDENSKIITAEDYDLWIRLAKNHYDIKFLREPLGTFRVHDKSESSNVENNINAICNVITKHAKINKLTDKKKKFALSNAWQIAGKTYQINSLRLQSLKAYLRSIMCNFKNIKSYFLILSLITPYDLVLNTYIKYKNEKNN
tara:strand:- start:202 stop:1116 length:915 start_codon:yes stop_codon:yes gene_type:complete